ncbi:PilZ domain-containing protein [Herbiconiux moechotypicola]|uniref:PilZ domain-containing protein n=1 Tax=Herbiconiux moechotypicola TaxID=637393 RepID=A0ABP5Q1U3_9MICO|nr:PilZ domain-containing protein [Herbiconiux moechotypicola]MCS5728352.1 PilZ domain-containing protein [Herbiconiux moechotypicola]
MALTTPLPIVSRPLAYRVPFRFDRTDAPRSYALVNTGDEVVRGLSFSLLGAGVMRATPPLLLAPGQLVRLRIRAENLPVSTVLVVRWFRPDDDEFLWRVSF